MARHVEGPFFRTAKQTWYVTHHSRKVSLGVKGRKNKKEAVAAWHRLLAGETVTPTPPTQQTVRQAVGEWLAAITVKSSTRDVYSRHLQQLTDSLGDAPLHLLTPERLKGWLNDRKVGRTTQKIMHSSVSAFLGWCEKNDLVAANPMRKVDKPKGRSRGASSVVSPQAHARLMKAARPELRVVLQLLHLTGARPAEICAITAENFDPTAGVVRLVEHKTDATGRDRVIHLPEGAVAILKRLAKKWGAGPLLRNSLGNVWTQPAVGWQVRALCKRTGVKIIPYGYRHSFATDALSAGVPDAQVAGLLGHSGTQMLHLHYSHVGEQARVMKGALKRVRR